MLVTSDVIEIRELAKVLQKCDIVEITDLAKSLQKWSRIELLPLYFTFVSTVLGWRGDA